MINHNETMKHTPSPWNIVPATCPRTGKSETGWDIIGADSVRIARLLMTGPTEGGPRSVAETAANRAMIIEAPAILEALYECMKAIGRAGANANRAHQGRSAWEAAYQIIARIKEKTTS